MIGLFSSIKQIIKPSSIIIDNGIFRLHYKVTVALLMLFSIVVTSFQFFGNPIECFGPDDVPRYILDNFCWIHGTFSISSAWKMEVGTEVPYPGVFNTKQGEGRVYHMYYQWVCFVLYLQAILFYAPRYLWKSWEGGRISAILLDLDMPIMDDSEKKARMRKLVEYFKANLNKHGNYARLYLLGEVLNFVNVVGNMYLTDRFLGGNFLSYGWEILRFSDWKSDVGATYNPMVRVFPRVTKCTFHMYGTSGGLMRHDALCLLPTNIMNEKIYIILWFWYIVLAFITAVGILYRFAIFTLPQARYVALRSRALITPSKPLKQILKKCELSDWLLLQLLCKNMEALHFRDLVSALSEKVSADGIVELYEG